MDTKTMVIGGSIIGVVVLVIFYQVRKDAIKVEGTVATAVNPVNPNNVFASGVNSVGSAVTGDSNFSLGVWLYDATHPASLTP